MRFFLLVTVLSSMVIIASRSRLSTDAAPPVVTEYEPIAVVELFTSQGCSSCPPADRLLKSLVDEAKGQPLYALSFHVAYWNHLGWPDPFSQEEFSHRQRQYARALGESVYTPQMIVNGGSVFVGSKTATARAKIQQAQQQATAHRVALTAEVVADEVQVDYQIEGPTAGKVLHLALVERDLSVDVKRGENGGRTLHHDNVVRAFKTVRLERTPSGSVRVALPDEIDREQASLVGYVQDTQTLAISGASQVSLSSRVD